ncbi:MAG: chordopoxvirus fusion protein [Deltaproteobacteria bacterium]|nr:MAG: chordopoxvirus fusion protein [Deltaproteobacteria bacterium]
MNFIDNSHLVDYTFVTMINTLTIFKDLSHYIEPQAAQKIAEILGQVYDEVTQTVTKKEFNELKEIVGDLVQAQKKTEERLNELAQAQRDLAQAQERTEISLNRLIEDHRQTRERLENISDTVGYTLENQSYKGLPTLLKRDLGIAVEGRLLRRYLAGERKGQYLQINIYGWGKKDSQRILILGEAKTSVSRQEIDLFQRVVKRAAQLEDVSSDNICQVVVVHDVTPQVEEYARGKGLNLYWSYDL